MHPASFRNAGPFGPFFSYSANVNSSPGANTFASTSNAPQCVAVISIPRSNANSGFCCDRTITRAPMFFFHDVGSGWKSRTCNGAHAVCSLMVLDACDWTDAASPSPSCDRVPLVVVKEVELKLPLFPLRARVVAKTITPEPARTFVHVFEDDVNAKRCDENASSFASRGLSNDWCSAILCDDVCIKSNSLSLQ